MNNKHRALWGVVALLIVFLAILIWRMLDPTPRAVAPGNIATSTPPAVVVPEPVVITDSGPYHDIEAKYPNATPLSASAGAEADAQAVGAMKGFVEKLVGAFKETAISEVPGLGDFGNDRKYAMDVNYEVVEGAKTVSYIYVIYQDTMGAHPNTYYRTFTFDRASGEDVHLDELFAQGTPYLDRLSQRTRADLPRIMAKRAETTPDQMDREYINSGTLPIADAFQNFVIEGNTLRMIFPPYQVGPYVYGTIEVPIPLADLRDILSTKYVP